MAGWGTMVCRARSLRASCASVATAACAPAILAPRTPRVPVTPSCPTRPGTMVDFARHDRGVARAARSRVRRCELRAGAECDKAVRVAPHGFGQHENPICARPRRLSPAITASNFDWRFVECCSACTAHRSLLHRELLIARPSSLPSTCSHHTSTIFNRAIGQRPKPAPVHKKLHFSTQFRSITRNPQRDHPARRVRVPLPHRDNPAFHAGPSSPRYRKSCRAGWRVVLWRVLTEFAEPGGRERTEW